MSRIAYIISAYKDPAHLARLIASLEGEADFYVHVDRNVDERPFRDALGNKAHFVSRYRVSWGGWNQVAYQRELLRAVIDSGQCYSHVVCLSAQDYPLWSNSAIHALFVNHPDREFICGYNLAHTSNATQRHKVTHYHPLRDLQFPSQWLKSKFIVGTRTLLALLPVRRQPYLWVDGTREEVYFGSDYWALTMACARYVLDRLDHYPAYERYFRTTFVPSELCVQTIVFNSPFAANAIRVEGDYPGLLPLTPLHYLRYHDAIKVFTHADFDELMHSGKPFCRKVVSGTSDALLERIDAARSGQLVAAAPSRRVLVIIVTYNGERWLRRSLTTLRHSHMPADCVIIDNGSIDATCQIIHDEFPEVRLICTGRNLGFGKANNLGLRMALDEGYDYAFLLNQDAGLAPDALSELVKVAESLPDMGVVSPVHLAGDLADLDYSFKAYTSTDSIASFRQRFGASTPFTLPFVNAALWLVPTRVVREVGGFDPLFFHYGEDTDLVNRLRWHGYHVCVAPAAVGYHDRIQPDPGTLTHVLRSQPYQTVTYWRTRLTDPHRSLLLTFLWLHGAVAKEVLSCLAHNERRRAIKDYCRALVDGWRQLSAFRKSRRESVKKQPSFLENHPNKSNL